MGWVLSSRIWGRKSSQEKLQDPTSEPSEGSEKLKHCDLNLVYDKRKELLGRKVGEDSESLHWRGEETGNGRISQVGILEDTSIFLTSRN